MVRSVGENVVLLSLFTGYYSTPYSFFLQCWAFRSVQARRYHFLPLIMFAPHISPFYCLKSKMFGAIFVPLYAFKSKKLFACDTIFYAYFTLVSSQIQKILPAALFSTHIFTFVCSQTKTFRLRRSFFAQIWLYNVHTLITTN